MFANSSSAIVLIDKEGAFARVVLDAVTLKLAKRDSGWQLTGVRFEVDGPVVDPKWSTNIRVDELPDSTKADEHGILGEVLALCERVGAVATEAWNGEG